MFLYIHVQMFVCQYCISRRGWEKKKVCIKKWECIRKRVMLSFVFYYFLFNFLLIFFLFFLLSNDIVVACIALVRCHCNSIIKVLGMRQGYLVSHQHEYQCIYGRHTHSLLHTARVCVWFKSEEIQFLMK